MEGTMLQRAFASASKMLRRWADAIGIEAGAVSTEYGVLLSLIAIVIIAAVTAFGLAVADLFLRGNRF
jgi:Flp pilus assembly pilin Flp